MRHVVAAAQQFDDMAIKKFFGISAGPIPSSLFLCCAPAYRHIIVESVIPKENAVINVEI